MMYVIMYNTRVNTHEHKSNSNEHKLSKLSKLSKN